MTGWLVSGRNVKRMFNLLSVGFFRRLSGVGWIIQISAVVGLLLRAGICVQVCQETACPLKVRPTVCHETSMISQPTACNNINYVTVETKNVAWSMYLRLDGSMLSLCTRIQASAAKYTRTALLWPVTQRAVLITCRYFGTTYLSHLLGSRPHPQGSNSWLLKMGQTGILETSVRNHHYTHCNSPVERRFRFYVSCFVGLQLSCFGCKSKQGWCAVATGFCFEHCRLCGLRWHVSHRNLFHVQVVAVLCPWCRNCPSSAMYMDSKSWAAGRNSK